VLRGLTGIAVIMLLATLTGWLLRDAVIQAGSWMLATLGAPGVLIATLLIDSCPLPLTNEPLMLLALGGSMPAWKIMVLVSVGSVAAGPTGYLLGNRLQAWYDVRAAARRRQPELVAWLEAHGAWGVAVAALAPIPFSLSTWTAGIVQIPLRHVALASLLRIPKTAFFLWLIVSGWNLSEFGLASGDLP
jgi:membrane protein YqaA with SNARE-associated domain